MGTLGAIIYDPATAVTKATIAALAMTALDTVNLRLTFTVPANGRVLVRMQGVMHGATTMPQVLLGILEGAVVKMRQAPKAMLGGTALATTFVSIEATAVISGLAAGASLTWDAAYGVETLVAATGIKYGGANDATANNAFGGFSFEIWEA